MKSNYKIGFLSLLSLMGICVSCKNSFFDKYPTDSMQMETYMKNDAEVKTILLDSYYYLRDISTNLIMLNSLATDEAYNFKSNNTTDFIELNECSWDATLGVTSELWTYLYNVVNRCNNVLEHESTLSDTNRSQFVGEASFLRAYAYFNLVRLFGPVPLSKETITDYKALYGYDRNAVSEVYELINSDLDKAISALPESYAGADMQGRATKIAAYTMKAEVLMTQKKYADAQTALSQVVSYSQAHPDKLGLESDVVRVYDSKNPMGKEIIFAAQYNNGSTVVTNYLMRRCIPNAIPSNQPSYVYADGTNSTILCSQGVSCLMMTWELLNKYEEHPADTRLTKLVYTGIHDDNSKSMQTAEVKVNKDNYAYIPATLKYYDFENQGQAQCYSSNDNIIYRFADVLLMYAECLNRQGKTAEALKYLNMVHERAGLPALNLTSQEAMDLAIENERCLELCFEGHRWFDLLRTDRLTPVMKAHFTRRTPGLSARLQADDNGMVVEDQNSSKALSTAKWKWDDSVKAEDILFPIPYSQIQLMSNWVQNKGY